MVISVLALPFLLVGSFVAPLGLGQVWQVAPPAPPPSASHARKLPKPRDISQYCTLPASYILSRSFEKPFFCILLLLRSDGQTLQEVHISEAANLT